MRILTLAIAASSIASSAFATDLGPAPRRAEVQKDQWAAVAVSVDTRKDAYGFQYEKSSAAGAEADAVRFCEERFERKGIRGGRCDVKSSTEYVVGIYCRGGKIAGIGTGITAAEAANSALWSVGNVNVRRCDFKVMRHGSLDKRLIESSDWMAAVACGGRQGGARQRGAMDALNAALKHCGDIAIAQVRIDALQQR